MRNWKTLLLAVAVSGLAHAGSITLDFDFTTLVAVPGQTVTARGTITNIDTAVVDLNACSLTLPGSFTTDSCAIFLSGTGAPLFLNSGDSATVDLFVYTPDINIPRGLQAPGVFTILGTPEVSGYDGSAQNDLLDTPVQLTAIPEPSTFALFGLSFPAIWALRRRRK